MTRTTRVFARTPVRRLGHVGPRTGPLAGFAGTDDHILEGIARGFARRIVDNGRNRRT